MTVDITTFGYKCGAPGAGYDLVLDVRDLPNPYYEPELAPLNGRDRAIAEYFADKPAVESSVRSYVERVRQASAGAGGTLRVAIGCTGGQHRSVYVAEQIAQRLRAAGADVVVTHRELAIS